MEQEHYSNEASPYLLAVRQGLQYLLVPVLMLLVVVLYLEFFAHVGHAVHEKLKLAEQLILLFFIAEVGTDFVLFEDKRTFLRKKWFDILLIIPFLQAFRAVGRAGRLFRGLQAARSLQVMQLSAIGSVVPAVKLGRIPLVAGAVAGEGSAGIRSMRALSKLLKSLPKVQKLLHFLRELPVVARYLPRLELIAGRASRLFSRSKQLLFLIVPVSVVAGLKRRVKSILE